MKNKTIKIGLLLCAAMFLMACKKDGCMDVNAENYDPEAKRNSGDLCTYKADLMVWFSQDTKDTLIAAYPLDIWIGGNSVATWTASEAMTAEPTTCAAGEGIGFYSESGSYELSTATVTVRDANNIELKQWFAQTFNGGECTKLKF
jgi:hypothetical protein